MVQNYTMCGIPLECIKDQKSLQLTIRPAISIRKSKICNEKHTFGGRLTQKGTEKRRKRLFSIISTQ